MKNILITFFLAISPGCFSQQIPSSEFLHTQDQKIVDRNGENVLLRGIGLGGHMLQEGYMLKVPFSGQQYVIRKQIEELIGEQKTAEFYGAWLANHTRKIDVDSLKSWGFNSVRLPMHFNLYTLPVEDEPVQGKNTWLEKGFQMTDSLLSWAEANQMYLILDMHAAPGGQGHDVNISDRDPSKPSLWESGENQQKLVALWKKLAERYKDEPWIGGYDLINEPNWTFEEGKNKNGLEDTHNAPLKKLMVEITEAIREVDKNHIIIIEGNGWGNNYNGILPPWDDNMVISFHKYWNYNDTASIQKFLDFREKYNTPVWLGETGENSNVWFTDAIKLMEENNIGWCWWPLKKLGFNNPLEVPVNAGYEQILQYWRGEAEKPSEEEAYSAFMQLAENTKLENNYYHKGVVDAMIRQPHSDKAIPFSKVFIEDSGILKAANYDMGKIGVAYHDNVAGNYYISTGGDRQSWNNGRTYRNDGVDIFPMGTRKSYDDVYVGDLEEGEWMQYTFTVSKNGKFQLAFRTAAGTPGKAAVQVNGKEYPAFVVPGSDNKWTETSISEIPLQKGENQLRFLTKDGEFKLEQIMLTRQK
ncbi:cellulase family glycosylhydrolase [Salinimicrobium xinjiangense]|uniref:cellulase family glycosylhydrolase n=1 Tax=Salinimicrobium xinjiangense TaxID=438596 RepID=UPI00048B82C2|nr:cellulase family glycosylhydrolase [Salinimicrobium xinjiangense]